MIFKSIDSLLDKITIDMREADSLIDRLNIQGYVANFILVDGKLKCLQTKESYFLHTVKVDLIYQIDDPIIGWNGFYIYAICEPVSNSKGVFLTQLIKTHQVQ